MRVLTLALSFSLGCVFATYFRLVPVQAQSPSADRHHEIEIARHTIRTGMTISEVKGLYGEHGTSSCPKSEDNMPLVSG